MLNRLFPILIVCIFTASSYSANVCNTLSDCQQFGKQMDVRIQELQPSTQFGDIVRNSDGSIRYMNQADAIKYCASQGQHLPSARELAQLAISMGAAGISETAKDGYYRVSVVNVDGKADEFYFSNAGYNRPAGDLGTNWFWSSSYISFNEVAYYAFYLDGSNGYVYNYPSFDFAVRCAAGE